MNTITNIKQNSSDKIIVSLVSSNFLTRWPCHVCGGHTEKVSILAEVTEGEYKGFRVCETCLETRDFDKKLVETAERLEQQSVELRELVGRLEVPSYAEWHQREFDDDIEVMRAHDYTDEQIVDDCIDFISNESLNKEYAPPRIDWLIKHGVTQERIDFLVAGKRAKNATQARDDQNFMEMHPDGIPF